MALGTSLAAPYFAGISSVADSRWDVAIGGHGFMIDMDMIDQFGRQTVPMIRQQSDTSDKPGEASLNPAGLWRRAQESWHRGAGQSWLDKPDSDPHRFNTSKGVDPWTRYGVTLLPATSNVRVDSSDDQFLALASDRVYASDNLNIVVSNVNDATAWNACSGEPGGRVNSLTSDGTNVYASFFGNVGIWRAAAGGTVFSMWVTTNQWALLRYAKGRLLASIDNSIYNPTAAGASPAALYTHPNADWRWTDVGEGPNHILLAGAAGDRSQIYKTAVKADGTALDIPTVAATLPDGEVARSITGYLGFVVIGTDKGVRFAQSDANGNLTLGSLIPTAAGVYCAEGQDRFVWFGWTNYDATSTGLGRLDLSEFTAPLTPAYASDIMATTQGSIRSVVTFNGRLVFAVTGVGTYLESLTKVASGTVTSGRITYGLPDTKTVIDVDVRHDPLPAAAAVTLQLATDAGTAVTLGTSDLDGSSVSPADAFTVNQTRGTFFEVTATLAGALTLRRVTLRADPSADRTTIYQVPLLFHENVLLRGDVEQFFDVDTEFAYLTGLLDTRQVVAYQEADATRLVVVEDYTWRPYERTDRFWSGTYIVKMKGV